MDEVLISLLPCRRPAALRGASDGIRTAPILRAASSAAAVATRAMALLVAPDEGERSAAREWKTMGAPRSLLYSTGCRKL